MKQFLILLSLIVLVGCSDNCFSVETSRGPLRLVEVNAEWNKKGPNRQEFLWWAKQYPRLKVEYYDADSDFLTVQKLMDHWDINHLPVFFIISPTTPCYGYHLDAVEKWLADNTNFSPMETK